MEGGGEKGCMGDEHMTDKTLGGVRILHSFYVVGRDMVADVRGNRLVG